MEKHNEKTEWIVKSSSQILGPFTTEQVNELIKKKNVIPIDEIIPEGGNWAYVRDVSVFLPALNQQAKTAGVEITKTQNVTNTYTDDMTSTELMDDTEELSQIGGIDRTNPNPKIQPIRSSQLPKPGLSDFIKPVPEKKPRSNIWTMLFLLIIATAIAGYYNKDWIISQTLKFNSGEIIKQSQQNLAVGDYKSAYASFQELNQLEAIKAEITGFYVQFAALVLNQERQTVYARDLLEKSKKDIKKSPEWLTTMGLSYLIDQNYSLAQKFLNQSINTNPDFLPAWINLGHLYFNQNKFQESWDFYYSAYLRGYREGHVTVYMALSLIEQWRITKEQRLLVRARDLLNNFLSTSADRRYLNQILLLWLDQKLKPKNLKEIDRELISYIESDPYISSKFRLNVYEFSLESKRFENFCSDIFKGLDGSNLNALLFKSLCYFKLGFVGRVTEEPIEKAESLYPKETLVFAVKSVILDNADETYQKSLLIGRALSSDAESKYVLPLILQARFCEQKNDMVCAAKYWNFVFEKNKVEIGAYVGLAKYYLSKNDNIKAKMWVADGLLLSPSYSPLLALDK